MNTNHSNIIPLIGYVDRLSARPGESLEFKISSTLDQTYNTELVRVISADPNPKGVGIIETSVTSNLEKSYPSRQQHFTPGSCGIIDNVEPFGTLKSFSVIVTIWPTTPNRGIQTLLAHQDLTRSRGFNFHINEHGRLAGWLGSGTAEQTIALDVSLRERTWYRVWLVYDHDNNTVSLGQHPVLTYLKQEAASVSVTATGFLPAGPEYPLSIAARIDSLRERTAYYNGKIEAPTVIAKVVDQETIATSSILLDQQQLVAHWDFSLEIPSDRIIDKGPHRLDGTLINYPARAMTGSSWPGREMCWRHSPEDYAAIHFHDDDIYDFNWETDFVLTLPEDMRSGIYAVKLTCGEHFDSIPFFVCPPRDSRQADICVIVSTFTYIVYGNHARPDYGLEWRKRTKDWNGYPLNPAKFSNYGLSTYNFHSDGSGVCHASHRRPLLTLRPGFITLVDRNGSGLRHFQADTHLYSWLEAKGYNYDILTDHELHNEGVDALKDYSVVTTGSHPEYHTEETLDALLNYRDNGGHLMYLGGDGFYWRIGMHQTDDGMIEMRRGETGLRAWAAEPGEYYNAFDGHYGGLWRRNGRPPQQLCGVGFTAQGMFEGSYYRRTADSYSPEFSWLFEGIDTEIIGDFGFSGGGAAGYELDRVDTRLGTPENAVVISRSENHGDSYVMMPEEQMTHIYNWTGQTEEQLIRADMTYFETPSGGAVYSTGSILFCGSLPWNEFNNNISRLLQNVLERFLNRGSATKKNSPLHGLQD